MKTINDKFEESIRKEWNEFFKTENGKRVLEDAQKAKEFLKTLFLMTGEV